jgi:hypothetical protein
MSTVHSIGKVPGTRVAINPQLGFHLEAALGGVHGAFAMRAVHIADRHGLCICVCLARIFNRGDGEDRAGARWVGEPDLRDPPGVWVRKRGEQVLVDQGEDGGVRADAEGQREYRGDGECRRATERSEVVRNPESIVSKDWADRGIRIESSHF